MGRDKCRRPVQLCFIVLMVSVGTFLWGQPISGIEFRNQSLQDIVASLAQLAGKTIITDQTVTGSRTFFFSNTDFETAFELVLSSSNLYTWEESNVIHVSRLLVNRDESGLLTVKGTEIPVDLLVQRLTLRSGTTIVHDALPAATITINVEGRSLREVLEIVRARIPEFVLSDEGSFFSLKRTPVQTATTSAQQPALLSRDEAGTYSLIGSNIQFKATLENLFKSKGVQFLFLKRSDSVIDRMHIENAPFSDMLRILLQAGDADVVEINGVSYVVELNRTELAKQYETVEVIPLNHLPVSALPNLFPSGLISTNNYKIDRERNNIILNGTEAQIGPVRNYIDRIDRLMPGRVYRRFDLNFLTPQEAVDRLPESLRISTPVILAGTNSFVMQVDEEKGNAIQSYLDTIDLAPIGIPVRLRYIRSENLLQNLPPSVRTEDIVGTNDPQLVFYRGSAGRYPEFLNQLKLVDQPTPQIRYQLLVIQYQEGGSIEVNPQFFNTRSGASDTTQFLGSIGNLLSLNFDVVSTFGYTFALDLSARLRETKARIYADTTLTGHVRVCVCVCVCVWCGDVDNWTEANPA